jgi:hypothetical protein
MKIRRRILAAMALILSTVGLLLSLTASAGVWIVERPVKVKAANAFERLETALDVGDQNLGQVNASLARAAERLELVRQEQRKLAQAPRRADPARRFLARTVQQQIAPEFADAREKLHTVAEAAVVVNSMLEDVGNFPLLSVAGLEMDGLVAMNNRLGDVGPVAWELSRLLGEPEPDAEGEAEELSRMERTLDSVRDLIARFEVRLAEVRQRTLALRSKTMPWITPAAVVISVAGFWIALSQISVMCRAWTWWKRSSG